MTYTLLFSSAVVRRSASRFKLNLFNFLETSMIILFKFNVTHLWVKGDIRWKLHNSYLIWVSEPDNIGKTK